MVGVGVSISQRGGGREVGAWVGGREGGWGVGRGGVRRANS